MKYVCTDCGKHNDLDASIDLVTSRRRIVAVHKSFARLMTFCATLALAVLISGVTTGFLDVFRTVGPVIWLVILGLGGFVVSVASRFAIITGEIPLAERDLRHAEIAYRDMLEKQ